MHWPNTRKLSLRLMQWFRQVVWLFWSHPLLESSQLSRLTPMPPSAPIELLRREPATASGSAWYLSLQASWWLWRSTFWISMLRLLKQNLAPTPKTVSSAPLVSSRRLSTLSLVFNQASSLLTCSIWSATLPFTDLTRLKAEFHASSISTPPNPLPSKTERFLE